MLAARGIIVSHETVRQWARKFGQQFANQIRRRLPRVGDKWHLDELKITGLKHWLWRAVDQAGVVLDVLVQRRRNKQAAKRLSGSSMSDGSPAPPCEAITVSCDQPAAGGTRRGMAQTKPASSRVIAAVTTLACLPLRASFR